VRSSTALWEFSPKIDFRKPLMLRRPEYRRRP